MGEQPGRLRRAMKRLTADEDEVHKETLQSEAAAVGAEPVGACCVGELVVVAGALRAVVLRPLAGVPTLEAELYDGSGTVSLVWLGRRRIRGIDPGRSVIARGRLTLREGKPTIFNPAYELRASSA